MKLLFLVVFAILLPLSLAQYGLYGGYGGYGGYGMPFYPDPYMMGPQMYGPNDEIPSVPSNPSSENQRDCRGLPSMRSRSLCRYGGSSGYGSGLGMGMGMGGATGCMDLNPQCSVWASTGQCATNAIMMRQSCALSCGTCATTTTGLGGSNFYSNPFNAGLGLNGLGQYPLSQFIGRSIYETGLLSRRPSSKSDKLPARF